MQTKEQVSRKNQTQPVNHTTKNVFYLSISIDNLPTNSQTQFAWDCAERPHQHANSMTFNGVLPFPPFPNVFFPDRTSRHDCPVQRVSLAPHANTRRKRTHANTRRKRTNLPPNPRPYFLRCCCSLFVLLVALRTLSTMLSLSLSVAPHTRFLCDRRIGAKIRSHNK